jgi:tRNA pseudouridine38-40 synthase
VRDAINGHLKKMSNGEAVSILAAHAAPDSFDARFSATGRHYLYRILNRRSPPALEKGKVWWVTEDAGCGGDACRGAAIARPEARFHHVPRRAVSGKESDPHTLDRLDVDRVGDMIEIRASARSFLHNQVRSMVGSLKRVGEGGWQAEDMKAALDACDRAACAGLAPPGLYLTGVDYPGDGSDDSQQPLHHIDDHQGCGDRTAEYGGCDGAPLPSATFVSRQVSIMLTAKTHKERIAAKSAAEGTSILTTTGGRISQAIMPKPSSCSRHSARSGRARRRRDQRQQHQWRHPGCKVDQRHAQQQRHAMTELRHHGGRLRQLVHIAKSGGSATIMARTNSRNRQPTGRAGQCHPSGPASSARRRSDRPVSRSPKAPAQTYEPVLDKLLVDLGQRFEVRKGHMLIHHMHGLAHKPELDHGAVILDEAGIRRAAGRRERRLASDHSGDRFRQRLDQFVVLGQEHRARVVAPGQIK